MCILNKKIFLVAVFLLLFNAFTAFAEEGVYIIKSLDFGQVTSARSENINIVIDGKMDSKPACKPASDCMVLGGSIGIVEFTGYGDKTITMHYPSEVVLKDGSKEIGRIYRMNVYSDATAEKVGSVQRIHLGGVLRTGSQSIGKALSSPIHIDFSVN